MIDGHTVTKPDGTETMRVHLVADPEPASLALTGADVPGLNADDVLAAGSTLDTPDTSYILFEDGGTFK
jgi:hypothetical protein